MPASARRRRLLAPRVAVVILAVGVPAALVPVAVTTPRWMTL